MFCTECGAQIPDDSVFCENRGHKVAMDPPEDANDPVKINDSAETTDSIETTDPIETNDSLETTDSVETIDVEYVTETAVEGETSDEGISEDVTYHTEVSEEKPNNEESDNEEAKRAESDNNSPTGEDTSKFKLSLPDKDKLKSLIPTEKALALKDSAAKNKRILIIAAAACVAIVLFVAIGSSVSKANKSKELARSIEESIYHITDIYTNEDEIIELYESYTALPSSAKERIANRDTLINYYKQIEGLIEERKAAAANVDEIIGYINKDNPYVLASTTKQAVIAYNNLDERARRYLQREQELSDAYDQIGKFSEPITAKNIFSAFTIEFLVGEKGNYGDGTSVNQSGYTINWNSNGGNITPNYDVDVRNDYATPVYIRIIPNYANLDSSCSFNINLHQTYTGLGIIDNDQHEFKLQQGYLEYDSSMGIGEYVIYVEDKDSNNSILGWLGWGFDNTDAFHKMDPFDVSRVEYSNISGFIRY